MLKNLSSLRITVALSILGLSAAVGTIAVFEDLSSQDASLLIAQFSSASIPPSSASSIDIPPASNSSISFSNPVSSIGASSTSYSSTPLPSSAASSFSFSRFSASSLSLSLSSLSIPRSSADSSSVESSQSSATSTTSVASSNPASSAGSSQSVSQSASSASSDSSVTNVDTGGTTGTTGTTGGTDGGGDGGDFSGLIGIGGTYGGIGPPPGVTGGGGGTAPRPSGRPAKVKDCVTSDNKLVRTCIPLIQPLGPKSVLQVKPGAKTFIDYFNEASNLLLTVAIGFCVLWILIGSYLIMISGSDGGKRSTGTSIITWAIIGLIIVNFAGFFLRTLNNMFFV